jgi:phage terminase large subunit-like protein
MQFMIKNDPPLIHFSHSPLWGWAFGNCMLQESNDGMENTKPVQCSANSKIDNIICLLMALHLYDQMQGTVQ